MSDNLFPTGYNEALCTMEIEEIHDKRATGYRRSVYFDDELGDFVRDGQFRLKDATGIEAWKQWCVNTVQTQRFASPYYSTDIGIDWKSIIGEGDHDLAESLLRAEITDALLADPYGRTKEVSSITFEWPEADALSAHVEAIGVDGSTIDFSVTNERGV